MERNGLPQERRMQYDSRICGHIMAYAKERKEAFLQRGVYGYYPHGSEVSLLALYEWLLAETIPVAFPRVSGETMEFYRVPSLQAFQTGAFNIKEPVFGLAQAGFERAFCLVPGSVFDRTGNRYGYGKGYYDRYFSRCPNLYRMGIAYEMQVEERIPAERYDMKMQALATETGVFVFAG